MVLVLVLMHGDEDDFDAVDESGSSIDYQPSVVPSTSVVVYNVQGSRDEGSVGFM